MAERDEDKNTDVRKRQAEDTEESYEDTEESYKERGESEEGAESRWWATVNRSSEGGEEPGRSGLVKTKNKEPAGEGGEEGGSHSL